MAVTDHSTYSFSFMVTIFERGRKWKKKKKPWPAVLFSDILCQRFSPPGVKNEWVLLFISSALTPT